MPDNVPALAAMYRESVDNIRSLTERQEAASKEARELERALVYAKDQQKHLAALMHTLPGGSDALAQAAGNAAEARAKQRPAAPARPTDWKSYPTTGSDATSVPTASPVKPAEDKPAKTKAPTS